MLLCLGIILGLTFLLLAGLRVPQLSPSFAPLHTQFKQVALAGTATAGTTSAPTVTNGFTIPSVAQNGLSLHVASAPAAICAFDVTSCSAGTGTARVTLSALASGTAIPSWPNVEVAFVVETTAYDGVYNHYLGYPGTDKCAQNGGLPCEESNGVPVFMDHAGQIAAEISTANPHSKVSFALVDFFATDGGDWDDGLFDGSKYTVDIPNFVPADQFGSAVTATLKDVVFQGTYSGVIGLDDNFLHSPSITALYGAVIGSGLDWSANTHHVIVLIGSTAPRDPSYVENYAISGFDLCCGGTQPNGWTCEPAFAFSVGASPNCEGWVKSQDGNPRDSIAALVHNSPTCTNSIGKVCTIDVINLWTTPTDPYSAGWPVGKAGAGPGGSLVVQDTSHVLLSGCDLAAATGGTWDGPSYFSCPQGTQGTLQYVPHGSLASPNTQNPTLMAAFRGIGFGPIYQSLVANGTNSSMFSYVPFGAIKVAPQPQWAAACTFPNGTYAKECQLTPKVQNYAGVTTYGWNWSTNRSHNAMYVGDLWTVAFNIVAVGPPYATVPIDACTTVVCRAGGSTAVNGVYTWAMYRPATNTTTITASFPLSQVSVELTPQPTGPPLAPPPPPPVPPGIPILQAPALPVIAPVGTLNTIGIANISAQATAAGFLGAGFTRVGLKNRPIAMKMAAMSGKMKEGSKFDSTKTRDSGTGIGRFE